MSNSVQKLRETLIEAREISFEAKRMNSQIAKLLVNNLRDVSPEILRQLKHELTGFNSKTFKWNP